MLGREALHSRLTRMRQHVDELEACRDVSLARYLNESMLRHAVERLMELIIEAATDVNASLIVLAGGEPPTTYKASFVELGALGIVDPDFAGQIAAFAGLRNALAYEYESMADEDIHAEIAPVLDQFRQYLSLTARYVERLDEENAG